MARKQTFIFDPKVHQRARQVVTSSRIRPASNVGEIYASQEAMHLLVQPLVAGNPQTLRNVLSTKKGLSDFVAYARETVVLEAAGRPQPKGGRQLRREITPADVLAARACHADAR